MFLHKSTWWALKESHLWLDEQSRAVRSMSNLQSPQSGANEACIKPQNVAQHAARPVEADWLEGKTSLASGKDCRQHVWLRILKVLKTQNSIDDAQ